MRAHRGGHDPLKVYNAYKAAVELRIRINRSQGLAEDILPSFQSKKKGDNSPEMEEERRNCFVAITRTKECLVLSRAEIYRGWSKNPSRFLIEMELVSHS